MSVVCFSLGRGDCAQSKILRAAQPNKCWAVQSLSQILNSRAHNHFRIRRAAHACGDLAQGLLAMDASARLIELARVFDGKANLVTYRPQQGQRTCAEGASKLAESAP